MQRCIKSKKSATEGDPALLTSFAGSFSAAAALIRGRPTALAFVREADAAGASFGGYAEDGPHHDTWPYTNGTAVYVPKTQVSDPELATSSFLFELNNAARSSAFADIDKKAQAGTISAQQYAHDTVAQEAEGMLKLAEVYGGYRDSLSNADRARLDGEYYWGEYQDVKAGRKTKEQVIQEVLKSTYSTGVDAGKTAEQYYIEEYNKMHPPGAGH
jgi:hypothetical protein